MVAAWLADFLFLFLFFLFLPSGLCSERRSAGLLEVKLIFQHTGMWGVGRVYKKVMSLGDELWSSEEQRGGARGEERGGEERTGRPPPSMEHL